MNIRSIAWAFLLMTSTFTLGAVAEEVEDPLGLVCANAEGDADCAFLAASGSGDTHCNVQPCGSVTATGNASCEPYLCAAASGTGTAQCPSETFPCAAASGTGDASGWIAASGCEDGREHGTNAACGTTDTYARADAPYFEWEESCVHTASEASCEFVSVSGTGNASGVIAVSALGTAEGGFLELGGCNLACGIGYEDPQNLVCVQTSTRADCEVVAVSGTGNANAWNLAVSGTGDATCDRSYHCWAVSGTREAHGNHVAASGTGDAHTCQEAYPTSPCVAASGTGNSTGDDAVSATGRCRASASDAYRSCQDVALEEDARGHNAAASATGDTDARGVSATGTGDARSCDSEHTCVAVSPAGNASGQHAVGGCETGYQHGTNALCGTTDVHAQADAPFIGGDETCVHTTSDASCGFVAVSGTGSASCDVVYCAAASGTEDADSNGPAVSGTGNADSCRSSSAIGGDNSCIAVSGTGDASGHRPISGCYTSQSLGTDALCQDADPSAPAP